VLALLLQRFLLEVIDNGGVDGSRLQGDPGVFVYEVRVLRTAHCPFNSPCSAKQRAEWYMVLTCRSTLLGPSACYLYCHASRINFGWTLWIPARRLVS
jgi:hypothetical protein